MLPLIIGAGVGGLLGLAKDKSNREEFDRKARMAAEIHKYSPWGKLSGDQFMPTDEPNTLDAVLQGVSGGLQMGQGISGLGGATPASPGDDNTHLDKKYANKPWFRY